MVLRYKREKLKDDDPFPFGKYKDTKMRDVPANYLDWLLGQDWIDDWPLVHEYIKDNYNAIQADLHEDYYGEETRGY